MKLLTASLEGKALDWALAVAVEKHPALSFKGEVVVSNIMGCQRFDHTDPALCLRLIKEYRANIDHTEHAPQIEVSIWYALTDEADPDFDCQSVIGDTVEQAVARCVVAKRLGDEVSVPDELVKPERSQPSSDDYKYCHNHD